SERLKDPGFRWVVAESGLAKKTLEVLKNARVYAQTALEAVKKADPDFVLERARASDYGRYLEFVPRPYREHWYACIHNYQITLAAKGELLSEHPNPRILGALMDDHQKILQQQIQNTPPKMAGMMDAARAAGALGAKSIGPGGGGCMLAVGGASERERVKESLVAARAQTDQQ